MPTPPTATPTPAQSPTPTPAATGSAPAPADEWATTQRPPSPDQVEPSADGAPADAEHPRSVWICENARCKHHRKPRSVSAQHLGQGLYLMGPVVCICGRMPVREVKR